MPNQGFPYALHVQQLACLWPTYDGYAKADLEEDLEDEVDEAWSHILAEAVSNLCQRMGLSLSTLEYRKTPSYWESEQRTWHLAEEEFDADFIDERQHFGQQLYLHLIGPKAIQEGDFFPDDLPLREWLETNYAFLILGSEEAVLWCHWPHPELFLREVQQCAQKFAHEMTHSKVAFRSYREGRLDYVEGPDEE
ncbi:MAG: hypothetical protein J0I12_03695 [Candidatus Eremiobacteraeota bacterium]|nr:hypothetical protein [Candidatus Eremiobacteraeota bacterium]